MKRSARLQVSRCPHVYGPEEDSELMLQAVTVSEGQMVLEMGCGTGFISLHCAEEGAIVTAVDIDPLAVRCAAGNAERNEVEMDVRESDLFATVPERFHLIIFNPPYLEGDCAGQEDLSWAGGAGGLDVLSRFLERAEEHLLPQGRMLVLVSSDMDQSRLEALLEEYDVRELARTVLFFETLRVLELIL